MNTQIIFICDRSGSMSSIRSDMEPAMNVFLAEQKKVGEDEATLKMVHFDDKYEVTYDGLLKDSPDFKLEPRGCTALLDAIGKSLGGVKTDGDAKTVAVILTDGYENASREWQQQQVADLIKKLDASDNFSVTYLGANQDAITVAKNLGIGADAAINFAATDAGVQSVTRSMSDSVASYRSGLTSAVLYSDADRDGAMKGSRDSTS